MKIKRNALRTPTLVDVAQAAGLSPITVSRALNTPEIVRPKTVAKVLAAVESTGYIPNLLAGGLASRRSKLVTVVVPQINNSMFVDTIQSINNELATRGYHMLLSVVGYDNQKESDMISTILSRRPDGIVLTGIHHSHSLKKAIINTSVPVVEIWDLTPTPIDMLVGFSHEKAGARIGAYLLEKGCKNFGLIWTEDKRAQQRKKGLIEALKAQSDIKFFEVNVPLPASIALGREGLIELLQHEPNLDAIACSSDTLAHGVIIEAGIQYISVPNKLSVIGFGDLDIAKDTYPALTTIQIDRWKIGKDAATMLMNKIEGKSIDNPIMDIGFSLVIRQSA